MGSDPMPQARDRRHAPELRVYSSRMRVATDRRRPRTPRTARQTILVPVLVSLLVGSCSSTAPNASPSPGATSASTSKSPRTESPTTTPPTTTPPTITPPTAAPTTTPPTTTTPPIDLPSTAYGTALADISEDGTRPLDSALRLFAIAIAPLPGVDAPTDVTGVSSGTLALKHVLAFYDQLSPEQQAVVDAARLPSASAQSASVPAGFARSRRDIIADLVVAEVKQLRADIAAKIGEIPGTIDVSVVASKKDFGQADPQFAGGVYSGCRVKIDAINQADLTVITNTVAHEVFHCFEAAKAKTVAVWNATGDWLIEGAAEWVGADITKPDGTEMSWWRDYLTKAATPLFAWTYQAIGFFSHLNETGTSPWSVFAAMFAAGGNAAAFAASGAAGDPFMTSWGSGFSRDPARGAAWDTTGPGITADQTTPKSLKVSNGDNLAVSAGTYRHASYALFISADIVIVQGNGFVRLNDGTTDIPNVASERYCTRSGGCGKCPDGTPLPDNPSPLAPDPLIAVSSGDQQSSGTIVGLSIEDYCKAHTAVWVHLDRPAATGVLAGTVVELYGCDGPFGTWQGVLRSGGLDDGAGFTVAFSDIPVSFAFAGFGAQNVHTSANGNVPTPIGNITLNLEMDVAIDTVGSSLSITGQGTAGSNIISVTDFLASPLGSLQIEPAPAGSCN